MSHIPPSLWESWSYHSRWKLGQLAHKYLPHVLTLYLLPLLKDFFHKKKNLHSSGLYSTCFVSKDVEHVLLYCPHFWTARNLFHSHLQALGFDFSFRSIISDNSEKYLLSFICSSKLFIWYVLVYFVLLFFVGKRCAAKNIFSFFYLFNFSIKAAHFILIGMYQTWVYITILNILMLFCIILAFVVFVLALKSSNCCKANQFPFLYSGDLQLSNPTEWRANTLSWCPSFTPK